MRWFRARATFIAEGQIREQITLEVHDAVHQLEEAKQALAAGATSFDLAQKTLTSEQRKYELGAETNFFVLDAQTRLRRPNSSCCRRRSTIALPWQPSALYRRLVKPIPCTNRRALPLSWHISVTASGMCRKLT